MVAAILKRFLVTFLKVGFILFAFANFTQGSRKDIDDSIAVNTESFFDVITKKINEVDFKIDLLTSRDRSGSCLQQNTAADFLIADRLCSLNSRMNQLEKDISSGGFHSSFVSSSSSASSSEANGQSSAIQDLISKLGALQEAFNKQETKVIELERRLQEVPHLHSNDSLSAEDKAETGGTCSPRELGLRIPGPKSLLYHLQKINFNVFLKKPANASSLSVDNTFELRYGLDGKFNTFYHSKQESNPWFCVDLQVPHLIWEIQITIRETTRAGGLKIFFANEVNFDYYGQPNIKALSLFGSYTGNSYLRTITFTNPGGMCGRYVIVYREIGNEYLIMSELQGVGFAFE